MQIRKESTFTLWQVGLLLVVGIALGNALVFLKQRSLSHQWMEGSHSSVAAERQPFTAPVYSRNIFYCTSVCYQPPERPQRIAVQKKVLSGHGGVTRLADIPKKPKNPNAIRISLAEAPPILSEVKMVNGKGTCAKKNDKGHKSKKYDSPHIDQQCCLDPDEIPNPRCTYK